MMARWGEIPLDQDTEPGIAAIEREQITKPRSMDLAGPLLHQPVKQEFSGPSDVPIECTFGDNLVTQTIVLNQHAKKMKLMLANLQQHQDNPQKLCDAEEAFLPLPLLDAPEVELPRKNFITDRCQKSDFERGIGVAPPEINEQLAKQILRKALAVMLAHAGFETTTESILETMVDVTNEFYLKLTRLLRFAVDREALVGGTSFPDVLEQVFHETGVGSMRNLGTFYQTRVVGYHNHMLQTCRNLSAEYKRIKYPEESTKEAQEGKVESVSSTLVVETDEEEEVVPQIHFPVTDEHEEGGGHHDASTLHLDELHSLQVAFEQETSQADQQEEEGGGGVGVNGNGGAKGDLPIKTDLMLSLPTANIPNLDPDEEIVNVIDSPDQANSHDLINESQLAPINIGPSQMNISNNC